MAGYIIVDVEITDEALFEEFAEKIVDVVDAYGGKYLVRGGDAEHITGDWAPHRVVVMEFESVGRAREWVNSPGYAALADIRVASATTNMIIVEGV